VALAGGYEVRQEGIGPVHHAPEVDPEEPLEVLVAPALDRRTERYAGVVEDHVHLTVLTGGAIRPAVHGIAIRHVHAVARDLYARMSRRLDRPGEALLVHVAQRQVAAAPGQS
jgi:hypothetical protein